MNNLRLFKDIEKGTLLDLDIIILSEVGQTKKDKYCPISLICGI